MATGIDTSRSAANSWMTPLLPNSPVPIAKVPSARANRVSLGFLMGDAAAVPCLLGGAPARVRALVHRHGGDLRRGRAARRMGSRQDGHEPPVHGSSSGPVSVPARRVSRTPRRGMPT